VEEVLELAPSVVGMILEAKKEIAEEETIQQIKKPDFFSIGNKEVIMQYTYNASVSLQTA
jgi:hypothetical protein